MSSIATYTNLFKLNLQTKVVFDITCITEEGEVIKYWNYYSCLGHRRSSSYGSTSEMVANMRYPEHIRHGNSFTDLHRPLSHEAELYCE